MKTVCKQVVCLIQSTLVVWALMALSLTSCMDESKTPDGEAQDEGQEVTLSVPLRLSDMENRTGETSTRAEVDKTPEEMEIKKLYMLQFDGTTDEAKLLQCKLLTVPTLINGKGSMNCTFKFSVSGSPTQTVYLVANVDLSSYAKNTTLTKSTFLGTLIGLLPVTSVPAAGLPYMASKEFDPMMVTADSTPEFSLKAMVAKVNYTYSMDAALSNYLSGAFTLTLKQVANGTTFNEYLGSGGYNPSGLTRTTEVNLGTLTVGTTTKLTGTVYLAENIAGQTTGITVDTDRNLVNAKSGATYLELKGQDITKKKTVRYVLFLGDPSNLNDFNVKRNCQYRVTNTITGVSMMDERVVMDNFINLSCGATANCYVITENVPKEYGFDAMVPGNNSNVGGITKPTNLSTAKVARVIWQTGTSSTTGLVIAPNSVKLQDGKIIFTTGDATEGNAVVGIFASSAVTAECLWSWHIWKLNGSMPMDVACVKNPSPATASASFKMMDRNLGAYNNTEDNVGSMGLIYQWGRKDPFPGPAGFNNNTEPSNIYGSFNNNGTTGTWNGAYTLKTIATSSSVGTEAWVVKYPTVFITNLGDWMFTSNGNLWGTLWSSIGSVGNYNGNQGVKSIFDPCPIGYRVPPLDFANKATLGKSSDKGNALVDIVSLGSFWFPFVGYRDSDKGALAGAGGLGRYWSSSQLGNSSGQGGNLNFNTVIIPMYNSYCSIGYPVRCVRE